MIIPTPWRNVPDHARVLDPAGNVFHVLPRLLPGVVQVRGARGQTFTLPAPPDELVPVVLEPGDLAVRTLAQHFSLEFLEER